MRVCMLGHRSVFSNHFSLITHDHGTIFSLCMISSGVVFFSLAMISSSLHIHIQLKEIAIFTWRRSWRQCNPIGTFSSWPSHIGFGRCKRCTRHVYFSKTSREQIVFLFLFVHRRIKLNFNLINRFLFLLLLLLLLLLVLLLLLLLLSFLYVL